jgi:hypothetical protein
VKTYYSTKADAGTLQEDDSWLEYNDSVDKNTVRSIAFEYLNQSGTPALLPAEAYIYTIVKMKSPTSSPLGSYAYNKFDAKWSAVDAQSGEIIQGITGIYSNTTKVALNWPFDIHVKKIWIDNDDELGLRPDEVYFELTKSDEKEDDYTLDVAGGEDAFDFLGLPIKDKDKYLLEKCKIICQTLMPSTINAVHLWHYLNDGIVPHSISLIVSEKWM